MKWIYMKTAGERINANLLNPLEKQEYMVDYMEGFYLDILVGFGECSQGLFGG